MPVYRIVIGKRPENYVTVYKTFENPGPAYENGKIMIQNIFDEPYDIVKHSISVEEQKE